MQVKSLTIAALMGMAFGQEMGMDLTTSLGNLPQLSNLTSYLTMFPDLVGQLSQLTNITLLAPNNEAFAQLLNSSAGAAITNGDTAQIQALLSYHVLNGTYQNYTMAGVAPTALQPPQFTNVTGGQVVLVKGEEDSMAIYSGLLQTSMFTGDPVNFTGGVVQVIDTVLTVPQNVSSTAVELNLTSIAGALTMADLVETVDTLSDVTVFVPNNAAFQAIGTALPNLTMEEVTSILTYHVVQGTVGYSSLLMNGTSLATVEGTNLTVTIEEDSVFVNSARVVTPDVLVANGVVHVIDGVLNPGNATAPPDPAASDSGPAFEGASSASEPPFTSGVPTPTSTVSTAVATMTEASESGASESGAAESGEAEGIAMPMKTGAVGAAALFGGAAVLLNM